MGIFLFSLSLLWIESVWVNGFWRIIFLFQRIVAIDSETNALVDDGMKNRL